MKYNPLSINQTSGADSTQAQEPEVKSFSSSSSNLNNASKREQSSSLELPSESIKGAANDVEVDEQVFNLDDYKSDYREGNPAVYCSTYHKYNCGSLEGAWLDITKFDDYEEFMAVCRFLHRDEHDPEFMFQDFENFPREWYTESGLSEEVFNNIQAYSDLSADEQEAFDAFLAYKGAGREDSVFEDFREAYCGEWASEEDFAEQLVDDCGLLSNVPDDLRYYFDFSKYARDLFMCDYYFESGHVFRCL